MQIYLKKFLFILGLFLFSTSAFANLTKVYFSCDGNNRVLLIVDPSSTERIDAIQVNKEEFKICDQNGDSFTFKKNICSVKSDEVKFNLSSKELTLTQQSKPTVFKCR